MSEVNADGVLLNPHEALLQEVQALTNSLTAEEPEGMEDDKAHTVYAGNGEPAGAVGGVRTHPCRRPWPPGHRGGHRQLRGGAPARPARKAARAAKTKKPKPSPPPKAEAEPEQPKQTTDRRNRNDGQYETHWVWWRQKDWWAPSRRPTPW